MKGKFTSLLLVSLLAVCFYQAGPASASVATEWYYYGFDDTVKPWVPGSNDGYTDENTLKLGLDKTYSNGYALLTNNYSSPVWMKMGAQVLGTRVRVEFLARDDGSCAGCVPIVYAGRTDVKHSSQFVTDFVTLDEEWRYYGFDLDLDKNAAIGTNMTVAIGFANQDDGCPINQSMAVDNVHITVSISGK